MSSTTVLSIMISIAISFGSLGFALAAVAIASARAGKRALKEQANADPFLAPGAHPGLRVGRPIVFENECELSGAVSDKGIPPVSRNRARAGRSA